MPGTRPSSIVPSSRPAAAVLTLFALAACSEAPPPAAVEPPPARVGVVQVEAGDIPVSFEFVGRTASSGRVEIRTRVSGFIEERVYREGAFVEAGEVLFRMDPKPFEVQRDAARAELTRQVAARDTAKAQYDRIRPLVEQDAVARKELDDALGAYQSAEAAVAGAEARVADAELDLGYTVIRSPVSGLSSFALQEPGAYVDGLSGGLLTYVAAIDPIRVEFSASENQALRIAELERRGVLVRPGADHIEEYEVGLVLADGRTFEQTGRLTFADASVDERTGTLLLRAEVPNPDGELRPGQFVRVRVEGAFRPDAIAVPQRAVQQGPSGSFVWTVDGDGRAEQRPVELGPWRDDAWIIEAGLADGDVVVVEGVVGLRPGMRLAVTSVGDGRRPSPRGRTGDAPAES